MKIRALQLSSNYSSHQHYRYSSAHTYTRFEHITDLPRGTATVKGVIDRSTSLFGLHPLTDRLGILFQTELLREK